MTEPSRDQKLESILHAYLQEIDADKNPDREELLRQHPELSAELREFFAEQENMDRFAKSMHKDMLGEATIGADVSSETENALHRIRYFGDYELLEEIARGGMGVVWMARQTSLNRVVALKMIRAGALARPEEVQRFLREAEAAANLQHPNIVAIHEVGEHDGQHYFSMDYVAGRDLGALVKDGLLASQRAANYVKIIAEAIHFAHQRGTLHRDLKPQNVLIDAADQPRITDFGLAKIMKDESGLTQTGVVMGSPSYMPPEQAAGRIGDIGPASDVYSLGAMLYELLTGRPPFRGATPLATLQQVLEAEPGAPRRVKADIPPDLETICLKCLEKSPSVRYPTARALADELDRFLKGEPILARPASTVRKVVSWSRRHPRTLVALATLVMVALAFGVFYLLEENAFLRAQQADPALARVPGPRYKSLKLWVTINLYAAVAGFFITVALVRRCRGLSSEERFDVMIRFRPIQPLGERTRTLAIGAGLILVGCGVMLLVNLIQAVVWEGTVPDRWGTEEGAESLIFPAVCLLSCLSIECGFLTLVMVIQDYRLVNYGLPSTPNKPSRPLTGEQIEPIRRALEDDDWINAVKRYREAVPDAGLTERVEYVGRLRESLRTQHPDKFAPPPLSLVALLKEMLIRAVMGGVIIGGLFAVGGPLSGAAWNASELAGGALIGMGLTAAGTRVKGFWKRALLLVPAIVLVTVTEVIRSCLDDVSTRPGPMYIFGIIFGGFQMFFGVKPRRKTALTFSSSALGRLLFGFKPRRKTANPENDIPSGKD